MTRIKESLYRVYLEFYVTAVNENDAIDCVQLNPLENLDFNVKKMLDSTSTEEALVFIKQLQATHVDDETIDKVLIAYLQSKGLAANCIDVVSALYHTLKERKDDPSYEEVLYDDDVPTNSSPVYDADIVD